MDISRVNCVVLICLLKCVVFVCSLIFYVVSNSIGQKHDINIFLLLNLDY